jgi:hypothetical protein
MAVPSTDTPHGYESYQLDRAYSLKAYRLIPLPPDPADRLIGFRVPEQLNRSVERGIAALRVPRAFSDFCQGARQQILHFLSPWVVCVGRSVAREPTFRFAAFNPLIISTHLPIGKRVRQSVRQPQSLEASGHEWKTGPKNPFRAEVVDGMQPLERT